MGTPFSDFPAGGVSSWRQAFSQASAARWRLSVSGQRLSGVRAAELYCPCRACSGRGGGGGAFGHKVAYVSATQILYHPTAGGGLVSCLSRFAPPQTQSWVGLGLVVLVKRSLASSCQPVALPGRVAGGAEPNTVRRVGQKPSIPGRAEACASRWRPRGRFVGVTARSGNGVRSSGRKGAVVKP